MLALQIRQARRDVIVLDETIAVFCRGRSAVAGHETHATKVGERTVTVANRLISRRPAAVRRGRRARSRLPIDETLAVRYTATIFIFGIGGE